MAQHLSKQLIWQGLNMDRWFLVGLFCGHDGWSVDRLSEEFDMPAHDTHMVPQAGEALVMCLRRHCVKRLSDLGLGVCS